VTLLVPVLFVCVAGFLSVEATTLVMQSETPLRKKSSKATVVEEESYIISRYDKLFQEIGGEYGVDWLLLSAIARAESEFRFDAVSKAGAVGLMQIMPAVARRMGYEREQLFDPRTNIEIAVKLLLENRSMLRFSTQLDESERLKFVLACYNAGYSRIIDARRLARFHDDSPDNWSVVASYLELLSEPEFAEHEVVQSGEFFGSEETILYVGRVMRIYSRYRSKIVV
jgi:membrane-bound lytic murein transglycosylase F